MSKYIKADKAYFIKLGESGSRDKVCIENGRIELKYIDVDHSLCSQGKWDKIKETFPYGANSGAKTRHINQIRKFYEEPSTTLWITFISDCLWWCFSKPEVVYVPEDRTKYRRVIGEWKNSDIYGNLLTKVRLSGKLLAVQSFRGTICSVTHKEYLLHKINDTNEPHVKAAENAIKNLSEKLLPIIKNLHPKDLEIFTDLIFRQAGWHRSGVSGETEKDIDLALQSPITQENIAVQVKSTANLSTYLSYKEKFVDMKGFSKFYFVTHSPSKDLVAYSKKNGDKSFILWDCPTLSFQAVRNGLVGWLIDRAS